MLFIKLYSFFFIIILFVTSEETISQSKKINYSAKYAKYYLQDSNVEYKVSAFFVDRTLRAHYTVQTSGKNFKSIMASLERQRKGLGIIIEKVWVVKKNRKEELLPNVPLEFRRETDSLLARYRAEQSH